ncbi:bifunctional tRNA (5-methylaminomethyl-2-thiouridine)(34)-methyltransferase MnmD/FAD-dependent 5-carboxymethylaminomethyl-2-thiouridine(34) oxidoreductase MnmC [Vibrio gallicus]|uniref:bifunctional tRNA (5-methylaminomethyl-2-thiouridine)(34)-methyltransferase MnmD/FAD-dependent 5-carboxymethylaminomethyl-2-thiouridine(34) oxidoreductase MnmC n=1 Tax=Vibrio gallicus TaxID=190897 RepID=UPI0021C3EC89|nr:bifunctional tRNA (5-methylaminomethyl-2-thiouridine)(34)-methyltransferase MnmD/FAD-dependent 5-carboxymethylaminomethyl-2-thiouridine(34) oxidoreductase MnmC [Vibrio gallicus]
MSKIKYAQLEWNETGTPISEHFDDVYFSNQDGLAETRYVFLTQNHIPTRWQTHAESRFVVAETGFGTGLNFLALWQEFNQFRQTNPDAALTQLHFISFEKFPVTRSDLEKAHQTWPELAELATELRAQYPDALPECHRLILADGAITLDLWFGDIKDCLPKVPTYSNGIVDAWFLDGFAPSKNPEMWNQDLFNGMAKLAKQDCSVATFTAAGFVRRGLIEAGFAMQKVKGFGIKREMLAGCMEHKAPFCNISPMFARATSPQRAHDIAIIGGGVASAALALALHRRGSKVTVYCKDQSAAQGASGNQQGALYPLLTPELGNVSKLFGNGFLFARRFYDNASQSIELDHDWCGVTQLMWHEKETKKLNKLMQGQFPDSLVKHLDAEQTDHAVGLGCGFESLYYPAGGWLSPQQCTQNLLDSLGVLRHSHMVQGLTQLENDNWQLSTTQGVFEHQLVIVANGHSFDQFSQTESLPLGKVKGQVSHIPSNDTLGPLKSVLCYDGYMTPKNQKQNTHCIGASYDTSNLNTDFDVNAQQQNRQKLVDCLPSQQWPLAIDVSDNHSRQGVRCVSRDHLPFVGNVGQLPEIKQSFANLSKGEKELAQPLSQYQGLYCLLGLGSRGLTSAPLVAELLASQIHQHPLPVSIEILEALHPSRMWVRKLRKGRPITSPNTV